MAPLPRPLSLLWSPPANGPLLEPWLPAPGLGHRPGQRGPEGGSLWPSSNKQWWLARKPPSSPLSDHSDGTHSVAGARSQAQLPTTLSSSLMGSVVFPLSLRPHHARWDHVPQKALPCLGICFRGTAIQVPCSVTNAACDRAYDVVPLPTLLHEDKYLVLCVPLEVGALSALPLESHRCLTPGRCHVCAGLGHLGGPRRVSTLMGDGSGIPSSPHRGGAPGHGEVSGPWSGQVARPLETSADCSN